MQKKIFYGWWIVAACFLLAFLFAGAGFYSFSIFIKPLENEFGWDRAAISLTMSIHFILGGLMGPVVGKLTQAHGPKKIMTFSAIGSGACFMLVSLTRSLWYFYTIYAFLALMLCGMGVITISTLLAKWFEKRRGTATGIALVGISAGGLILAPVMGLITTSFGWRTSYLFLGLLVWFAALPVIRLLIKDNPADIGVAPDGENEYPSSSNASWPEAAGTDSQSIPGGWSYSDAFRSRAFWCISVSFFLASLAQMGILQHQVPMIVDTGVTEATAATALGMTAGIGGLGKLSFGRISEILPFRCAVILCFALQAMAVFSLLHTRTMAMVWVYVAIFGFSMGGVVVLMSLTVGNFFGLASFSVILGIIWFINALGGALGTYVSGLIYDYLGSYQIALYGFMASYLTAIIAIFMAGKPDPYFQYLSR
jgi:MFS transporter, OFA family, oxalate/formate antiporter